MVFWRFYAIFTAVVTLFTLCSTGLHTPGSTEFWDYANLAETVLEFMGLFGFVFRFPTFSYLFWKIAFPVLVLFDIGFTLFIHSDLPTFIFGIVYSIPMYAALFLYGYRSEELFATHKE